MKSAREMDPDWGIESHLDKCVAEVDGACIPVKGECQCKKQPHRTPRHNGCESFRFTFFEVASYTVPCFVADFTVRGTLTFKNQVPGKIRDLALAVCVSTHVPFFSKLAISAAAAAIHF